MQRRLPNSETLFRDGLVEVSRLNASKRELARLEGEAGNLTAEIASARTAIAGSRAKIAENTATFRAGVLEDLRDVGLQIAELLQQKIAAEDRLAKLEIRAPQSGIVHESIVQTVGGVVSAGETLMQVVPRSDRLALEARVSPLDIDKLTARPGCLGAAGGARCAHHTGTRGQYRVHLARPVARSHHRRRLFFDPHAA